MAQIDLDTSRCACEHGQTMAEYGVVLTVVSFAVVTAVAALSVGVQASITRVIALLPG